MKYKRLFFCSRMSVFDDADFRDELNLQFSAKHYLLPLYVHKDDGHGDVRAPCAQALMESTGIVLLLDGNGPSPRNPTDASVIELEVMLAAVNGLPIFAIDASDGYNPIIRALRSEFFSTNQFSIVSLSGTRSEKKTRVTAIVSELCTGERGLPNAPSEAKGWKNLAIFRPDRVSNFRDDGRNFPFSTASFLDVDFSRNAIEDHITSAESCYVSGKNIEAQIHCWDALRALGRFPWAQDKIDPNFGLLWLRALKTWSGTTSWMGLFGHTASGSLLAQLAALSLSSRLVVPETQKDGPLAAHYFYGGIGSTYFSLSRKGNSLPWRAEMARQSVRYINLGLRSTSNDGQRAGLLTVRGVSLLSIGNLWTGFSNLHEAERLHKNSQPFERAALDIQLGAAYKELSRRTHLATFRRKALKYLGRARESTDSDGFDLGQRLMCNKHFIETLVLGKEVSKAQDIWIDSMDLARTSGHSDQLRQLTSIGNTNHWRETLNEKDSGS
jgi:hypothetical protein